MKKQEEKTTILIRFSGCDLVIILPIRQMQPKTAA
jgi:hypothetical protein